VTCARISPSIGRLSRAAIRCVADHPWLITAFLSGLIVITDARGVDAAAQAFRVWQFRTHGFVLWDLHWYGGHADLGYSVLFPAIGSVLGALPTTALAATLSSWLFSRLFTGLPREATGPLNVPQAWAGVWFAVFAASDVLVGSGPFACSVACGVAAVLGVRAHRPVLAAIAALATSLFSPLGAAFLLLVGVAWGPRIGWRRSGSLLVAGLGLVVPALVGDGGVYPFPASVFFVQMAVVTIGLLVIPRQQLVVRRALILLGATCVVLFVVPNPVGSNVARLAALTVGPTAAYVLLQAKRARLLAALTAPLLTVQILPAVSSVAHAAGVPSMHASYYRGLLTYLTAHTSTAYRVEIPATYDHWEATFVAEKVDLARGWYRQVDVGRNAVLYHPLTADGYRQWLNENAVAYVALPDAPLDEGGKAEAALLAHPPGWLRPVYHDAHWQVWRVADATPIATGAGQLTGIQTDSFTLSAARTGTTVVRLRWSPYWHLDAGSACVSPGPDGWTQVRILSAPTAATFSARFGIDNHARCPEPAAGS
jgi:hypothetical protein